MIFNGQRRLAAEILGVGENKVLFDKNNLEDIKKAITRFDIKELIKEGAIKVRIKKKSKKSAKEKTRRGTGSRRIRPLMRKEKYIHKIRKLRKYIQRIFDQKIIDKNEKKKLRKMAKAGELRSLRHLQEHLTTIMNKKLEVQK